MMFFLDVVLIYVKKMKKKRFWKEKNNFDCFLLVVIGDVILCKFYLDKSKMEKFMLIIIWINDGFVKKGFFLLLLIMLVF